MMFFYHVTTGQQDRKGDFGGSNIYYVVQYERARAEGKGAGVLGAVVVFAAKRPADR